MKEIKFRAWDTKRNKMWSAEQLGDDQVGLLPDGRGFANISGENHNRTILFEHLIPLQYTGLKDKNDVEIYEGDFFKEYDKIYVIEYDLDYAGYSVFHEAMGFNHKEIEIIGNIYEKEEGKK